MCKRGLLYFHYELIVYLPPINHESDLICLSEVWATNLDFCAFFLMIKLILKNPKKTKSNVGGLALFTKTKYSLNTRNDFKINPSSYNVSVISKPD